MYCSGSGQVLRVRAAVYTLWFQFPPEQRRSVLSVLTHLTAPRSHRKRQEEDEEEEEEEEEGVSADFFSLHPPAPWIFEFSASRPSPSVGMTMSISQHVPCFTVQEMKAASCYLNFSPLTFLNVRSWPQHRLRVGGQWLSESQQQSEESRRGRIVSLSLLSEGDEPAGAVTQQECVAVNHVQSLCMVMQWFMGKLRGASFCPVRRFSSTLVLCQSFIPQELKFEVFSAGCRSC